MGCFRYQYPISTPISTNLPGISDIVGSVVGGSVVTPNHHFNNLIKLINCRYNCIPPNELQKFQKNHDSQLFRSEYVILRKIIIFYKSYYYMYMYVTWYMIHITHFNILELHGNNIWLGLVWEPLWCDSLPSRSPVGLVSEEAPTYSRSWVRTLSTTPARDTS